MTRVKPKLYLNMSPETVEEGGLIFARNMKIDDDGHLTSDYGYKDIDTIVGSTDVLANKQIIGHVVGLDNKIYLFTLVALGGACNIYEYDEVTREITANFVINDWTYGGGNIVGCVSTNISGEKILTVGEEIGPNYAIPLKHINLNYRDVPDESFYTQAPICPTANLALDSTYIETIPSGVYVFFIRYKLRKDVYTNWFLCSRPVFAGTSETTTTIQGGLKYINTHKDSAKSFIFDLSFVNNEAIGLYDEFQLGFIITHDDATDARTWKHFKIPNNGILKIYFNYDNVKEANIDELLANTYELYNVGNITNFKNKLYISNYRESNFNPDLSNINLSSLITLGVTTIDNENAQGYADVKLKLYNDSFVGLTDFVKISDAGWYTKRGSTNLSSLSASTIRGILDVNISDFYKDTTSELENALTFEVFGTCEDDPDIVYISAMANGLYNKELLGNDFSISFNSAGHGWADIGISLEATSYSDVYKVKYSSPGHPLHGDMTYAYGIFGETAIPAPYGPYSVWNTIPINAYNINNSRAYTGNGFITENIRSTISREIKNELSKLNRFILGYAIITSGATKHYITTVVTKDVFDKDNYVGGSQTDYGIENKTNSQEEYIASAIKTQISNFISSNIVGIDDNGTIVLNYNGEYIKLDSIEFAFKACEFVCDNGENINRNDEEWYNVRFNVTLKSTIYKCLCNFSIYDSYLDISPKESNNASYKQRSTLMPLSKYKAYVHFVDKHNIITNGYELCTLSVGSASAYDLTKHVLQYSVNSSYLDGLNTIYRSFFISIKPVGDIIVETFGNTYKNGYNIVHCLEADALLYNINDDIILVDRNGNTVVSATDNAKYYSSGESIPSIAFGNCGFIAWKSNTVVTSKLYVRIQRTEDTSSTEHEHGLIKATPYLRLASTSSTTITDGFYGSYFCSIKKPSFSLSSTCYVSGNDVYSASRGTIIKLSDFEGYINMQDSNTYFVRSNYNLNYLTLVEDISDHIHKTGSTSLSIKQVVKVVNSAILSFIYELKGMYKNFMNKTFTAYDEDYIVQFDNTIRVSNVLSDETFNNAVFKFEPENYYNVPTDRGKIISLFSIGNNIFVHTTGSLYKFDANQTIMASDTDIKLQESEPFSAGITQIIDSQYGYGGISNREAGCVTFDSYFFYDSSSTHIFAYGGNSQIQLIDATIYKLLRYYSPTYCKTLHDDINHRVLFMFTSYTNFLFTLSYNYKSKTFVSFHDLNLAYSFAGRTRCFSYIGKALAASGKFCELFNEDTDLSTLEPYSEEFNIVNIYGDSTYFNNIFIHGIQTSTFNIAVVLFPSNSLREVINYVKYLGEVIEDYFNEEEGAVNNYYILKIPKHNNTNPVKSLQIVTDTCLSNIIDTTVDDTVRPDHSLSDHKGFKHEIDSWNTNYFRNILNINNIYNYPGETDENGPGQPRVNYRKTDNTISTAHPNSDNHSLVYGKYYVLLFNFKDTVPIKFEEVFINSEKY